MLDKIRINIICSPPSCSNASTNTFEHSNVITIVWGKIQRSFNFGEEPQYKKHFFVLCTFCTLSRSRLGSQARPKVSLGTAA